MTLEEYEWLVSDEATRAVAENRGRDPLEVALDTRVPHARLVATQVKYCLLYTSDAADEQ